MPGPHRTLHLLELLTMQYTNMMTTMKPRLMTHTHSFTPWLLAGDIAAALVVTLIGFLTHYGGIEGWRWLSTFVPVTAAWLSVAPWFGAYDPDLSRQPRQVWRFALAAFFSAPLAATLRGLWLNAAVLPVFVVVMALTNALGFLVWRLIWALVAQRIDRNG